LEYFEKTWTDNQGTVCDEFQDIRDAGKDDIEDGILGFGETNAGP
jgi:hypothetical protein